MSSSCSVHQRGWCLSVGKWVCYGLPWWWSCFVRVSLQQPWWGPRCLRRHPGLLVFIMARGQWEVQCHAPKWLRSCPPCWQDVPRVGREPSFDDLVEAYQQASLARQRLAHLCWLYFSGSMTLYHILLECHEWHQLVSLVIISLFYFFGSRFLVSFVFIGFFFKSTKHDHDKDNLPTKLLRIWIFGKMKLEDFIHLISVAGYRCARLRWTRILLGIPSTGGHLVQLKNNMRHNIGRIKSVWFKIYKIIPTNEGSIKNR